ncbi:MAG: HEPN domain-containing protein [Candidatus Caldarchaeum sp.]|nr:HEPN domain-containing protein [Candidatus Caldarchaeum sp.]MCS7138393.1 HEPN domain-containing protein [Candidatus Caldarchaeum sp.]MDW7977390.1 HEPN domain-containing protein [Candidatus Caldarchaeum sp.]MDW8359022.1 HEPN domain-containing protein [Candidatus Caldarchaeum sp.]
MPQAEEVELLRRRARSFLARAEESVAAEDYDISCFLAEQALQLHLKSLLLEELGDFPRTHSISFSLQQIKKLPKHQELAKLLEGRKNEVRLMEDAYIASRYLPRRNNEDEAKLLVRLVREVLEFGVVF